MLAAEALQSLAGQHRIDCVQISFCEVTPLRGVITQSVVCMVGPRSVTCARDADEIVFFSPS